MSTKVASLYAEIGADTSGLKRGADEAKSTLDGLKGKMESVGSNMSRIGTVMTAAVTLPIVAGFGKMVNSASDLSETMNKVSVVFGESAKDVLDFGDNAARALGMSKNTALEAAGTFGNLFTSMGLARDKSAEMSTSLLTLAADLASFNNIDPTVALEKLRAGLVGEVEPLRTLGVNLTAATVEAKAFEMGLVTAGEELDAAAKAQASYALIMEQTTNAQGDFARTSDGLANTTRIVKAQIADVAAEMGENLLPIALDLMKGISGLVQKFSDMDPRTKNLILTFGGLAAAMGPVLSITGKIIQVGPQLLTVIKNLDATKIAAVAAAAAVVGVFVAADKLNKIIEEGVEDTEDAWQAWAREAKELGNAETVLESYTRKRDNANRIIEEGSIVTSAIVRAQVDNIDSGTALSHALLGVTHRYLDYQTAMLKADQYQSMLTTDEYKNAQQAAQNQHLWVTRSSNYLIYQKGMLDAGLAVEVLTHAEYDLARATNQTGMSMTQTDIDNWRASIANTIPSVSEAEDATVDYGTALSELNYIINSDIGRSNAEFIAQQDELEKKMAGVASKIEELKSGSGLWVKDEEGNWRKRSEWVAELETDYDNLKTQYDENAAAHNEATSRIILDLVAQRLALTDMPIDDQINAIAALGVEWGIYDEDAATAIENSSRAVQILIEQGLDPMLSYLNNVKNAMLGIEGTYNIRFSITTSGQVPFSDWSFDDWESDVVISPTGSAAYASGTDSFVVPPGYPNDNFPVYLTSGEKISVAKPGEDLPSSGNTYNITVNAAGGSDGYELYRQIKEAIESDMRAYDRAGIRTSDY